MNLPEGKQSPGRTHADRTPPTGPGKRSEKGTFLERADRRLAAADDSKEILAELTRLSVPDLADWCVADLAQEGGPAARAAFASADPAAEAGPLLRETAAVLPPRTEFRKGGDGDLSPLAADPDAVRTARRLGVAAFLSIPLDFDGRQLGALTLVSASRPERYGPDEVALAEKLARLASGQLRRALELERAVEELRRKDDFLSIVSHELRTPIAAVRLAAQNMERSAKKLELEGKPGRFLRTALKSTLRQSRRLQQMVHNLLDLSRISTGRLEIDPMELDLAAMARDVASEFEQDLASAACPFTLSAAEPVVGCWDRLRIEQVLLNLLTNALRCAAGKPIELTVRSEGPDAFLVVRDEGPGIPREKHLEIFERFKREVEPGSYQGLGLGLFIVREIVQAHRGSVRVESEPGQGAAFTVRLPLAGPVPGACSGG